jgi:hypothetical protein
VCGIHEKYVRLVTCDHAVTALTKEISFWHSLISFVIFEKKIGIALESDF